MISIHLRRTGAKKDPHYRVVVADSRDARDGSFIEVLGHYHPRFTPARVTLDLERIKSWISRGAQPSDTVKSLVRQVESGKLDALPDLPQLEPMPASSIEAEDEAPVETAAKESPEAADADASPAPDTVAGEGGEPGQDFSEVETAEFPVPEAGAADDGAEAGEQEAAPAEEDEPEKATQ